MRKLLTFALKAVVSCVLLYFAFSHVKFDVVGQQLGHLNYGWLAAAILILIAQLALGALRWQRIVLHGEAPDAPPFTIARALRYGFIAGFFNQTLPSTVGGDAVRIWLLGRDQGGWQVATYSVLIDRMVGVLVLASLVIVCLPWSFALIGDTAGRSALLVIGFGSVGACSVFHRAGIHPLALARALVADAPTHRGGGDGAPRLFLGLERRADHRLFADHPRHVGQRGLVPGQIGGRASWPGARRCCSFSRYC